MDSLKSQKVNESTSSSAVETTNSKPTNNGLSVPAYHKSRNNWGNVGGGNFGGSSNGVLNIGASGDGAGMPRNPKSPFTICGDHGGPGFGNGNRDSRVPNLNNSSNNYPRPVAFPFKGVTSPLPSYGIKVAPGISTFNINSVHTAGASGGGDAPYLGATASYPYAGNSSDMLYQGRSLNNIQNIGVVTAGDTVYQKLSEYSNKMSDVNAAAAGTAATGTEPRVRYSRKVFIGGLPPDINEEEIINAFRPFGTLIVDWPHKFTSKSEFPPKGYAFLIFHEENSIQQLVESCTISEDKLYLSVSSTGIKDKPVQIRPWRLADASYILNPNIALDPRKTIFVGGVPRPLKAYELAMIMDRLYGGVCYAGIDTDPELKYPKGAGRVVFYNQNSYVAAISARFIQLQQGDIDKRVEVKPYVLGNQLCDECKGQRCGGKFAAYFCTNLSCLQYYCEYCWAAIHSWPGRQYHKPLVKEGGVRPRVTFR